MHSSDTVQSLDQDLADAIKNLKRELRDKNEICSEEGALRHAIYKSAILVGEDQNAILLPTVVDYLETNFNDIVVSNGISPLQNTHDIKNSNWLLSELSALSLLQHHMAYRCSVKRYGTVLYRYGGDLLHALNVSLGKSRAYVHK